MPKRKGLRIVRVGKNKRKRIARQRANIPRNIALKNHKFVQMYRPSAGSFLTTGGVGGLGYNASTGLLYSPDGTATYSNGYFSLKFTLADLPQVNTYASLFDAYRINHVKFEMLPVQGAVSVNVDVGSASESVSPLVCTVIDYDDFTLPTTMSQLEEYSTFMNTTAAKPHHRSLVPALSMLAFKTSGTTIGYVQKRKEWIDIVATDCEFYGIKGAFLTPPSGTTCRQVAFYIKCYMEFECKQVR